MPAELLLLTDALVRATPLMLAGLSVALAFRGGILNIGAEGQLLVGAVAATVVSLAARRIIRPRDVGSLDCCRRGWRVLAGQALLQSSDGDFRCSRLSAPSC